MNDKPEKTDLERAKKEIMELKYRISRLEKEKSTLETHMATMKAVVENMEETLWAAEGTLKGLKMFLNDSNAGYWKKPEDVLEMISNSLDASKASNKLVEALDVLDKRHSV